jgi:hypothetical protein
MSDITDDDIIIKPYKKSRKNKHPNIGKRVVGAVKAFNIKHLLILIIVFIFITHETFVSRVLSRFSGATTEDNRSPTFRGTLIQCAILSMK